MNDSSSYANQPTEGNYANQPGAQNPGFVNPQQVLQRRATISPARNSKQVQLACAGQ